MSRTRIDTKHDSQHSSYCQQLIITSTRDRHTQGQITIIFLYLRS